VATIAVARNVDQITSQPHHIRILAVHVERNPGGRRKGEPDLDHLFFILRAVVVIGRLSGLGNN